MIRKLIFLNGVGTGKKGKTADDASATKRGAAAAIQMQVNPVV
jgi:hypothetical protein